MLLKHKYTVWRHFLIYLTGCNFKPIPHLATPNLRTVKELMGLRKLHRLYRYHVPMSSLLCVLRNALCFNTWCPPPLPWWLNYIQWSHIIAVTTVRSTFELNSAKRGTFCIKFDILSFGLRTQKQCLEKQYLKSRRYSEKKKHQVRKFLLRTWKFPKVPLELYSKTASQQRWIILSVCLPLINI